MRPLDGSTVKWRNPRLVPLRLVDRGQLNCLTMLLRPAKGSFLLLLLTIVEIFRGGNRAGPISGRAAAAIGKEAAKPTTTKKTVIAMAAAAARGVADLVAFNRGMKTVS